MDKKKYEELRLIMINTCFIARNGLPDPPRCAKHIEDANRVAMSSYQHDCVCFSVVNRAVASIMEVFSE